MTTFVGTIEGLTRLPNSVNGNPRFRVWVSKHDDYADEAFRYGEYVTQSDAALGYGIENPDHRSPNPVRFTLTRAGRIAYAEPV